jgi:hypothetical protein
MEDFPDQAGRELFGEFLLDGVPYCLASTQALRSRSMSSASKSPDYVIAHRSDRSGAAATPSSVL